MKSRAAPSAPLPQEGGSYIRKADGSLHAAGAPEPSEAPAEPAENQPVEATPAEPAPSPRRASKQPVKDA